MSGSRSLKREIYLQIFEKIMRNEFPLDEFLVESKLAQMFGVSRAPVREALVELCNEKVLRNIPRAGYQIVQLTERELRDALQLRLILETEAMRLACDRVTEESTARLRSLRVELQELAKEPTVSLDEWMSSGSHLHLTIGELSGNRLLLEKIREVHGLIRRATVQIYLDQSMPSKQQPLLHGQIVDAMIDGRKEEAVRLLREDISLLQGVLREA